MKDKATLFQKRVSNAIFWNHLNKVGGYSLDFLLSVVLTRGLGVHEYGLYAEIWNIIFLFSLFSSFGVDTAVSVYIPKHRDNPSQLSYLIKNVLRAVAVASAVVCGLVLIFREPISTFIKSPQIARHLVAAAFYIVVYNLIVVFQAVLTSFYKTKFLFVTNLSLRGFLVLSAFVITQVGLGIYEIFVCFSIVSLAACIMYLFVFRTHLSQAASNDSRVAYWRFGLTAWLTKFLNYALGRYFDIFLLGYFGVLKEQIGYYNLAFSLTIALSYLVTSGLAGVALSAFSDLAARKNYRSISEGWTAVTKVIIFFCLPIFGFSIANGEAIIMFFFSSEFRATTDLFQVFAIFFLASLVLGSGINTTVLYSLDKEKAVLYSRALLGFLNLILNLLLIPSYGAMGAIIATGISTLSIILCEYVILRRCIKIEYPTRFLLKVVTATVFSLFATSVVQSYSQLIGLLSSGLVFVFSLSVGLFLLKPLSTEDKLHITFLNKRLGLVLSNF